MRSIKNIVHQSKMEHYNNNRDEYQKRDAEYSRELLANMKAQQRVYESFFGKQTVK